MMKYTTRDRRIIIFILTDPTLVSINHIQQAHKKADNGFNDLVAQLYKQEFKTQENAKQERIKQAKEKALEEQRADRENKLRIEAEQRAEADRIARANIEKAEQLEAERQKKIDMENEAKRDVSQSNTMGAIGSYWSSVSPEIASQYMSARTGVSASTWQQIIYRESTNNPTVTNSIGCFGYLQLHPVHGNVSGMTPQQYLDTAVGVYNSQGLSAWEVVTMGMVN